MYNLLDPELIVIGGRLSGGEILIDPLLRTSMVPLGHRRRRGNTPGDRRDTGRAGGGDRGRGGVLADAASFPLPLG